MSYTMNLSVSGVQDVIDIGRLREKLDLHASESLYASVNALEYERVGLRSQMASLRVQMGIHDSECLSSAIRVMLAERHALKSQLSDLRAALARLSQPVVGG